MRNRQIIICESNEEVSRRGAEMFVSGARDAVTQHREFRVALSGGSTPRSMYALLAESPFREAIDWTRVQFFWGDERCVPPDDPDSNYRMAKEALLSKVPVPADHVHRMPVEMPNSDAAAAKYQEEIMVVFGLRAGELPRFDLVLLGMGDDGHTASLFPGTTALHETERLVAANYVPKLSTFRLTLTVPVLNNAEIVLFLAPGAAKAQTLHEVLEGPPTPDRLPSQSIQPANGRLIWLIDRDAARNLEEANS